MTKTYSSANHACGCCAASSQGPWWKCLTTILGNESFHLILHQNITTFQQHRSAGITKNALHARTQNPETTCKRRWASKSCLLPFNVENKNPNHVSSKLRCLTRSNIPFASCKELGVYGSVVKRAIFNKGQKKTRKTDRRQRIEKSTQQDNQTFTIDGKEK